MISEKPLTKDQEIAQLQKKLNDKEMLFENILDGTLAGYWDWSIPDGHEYLSPRFKEMFGYEDHEMENSPESWQKIIFPEDLANVFELFGQHVASKGKVPFISEARYNHKSGSVIWVYCRGKVVEWDDEGNPLRAVGSHVDITEIKKGEEAKKRAKFLMRKNSELEQFAFVASHDLQEPLRTIGSLVDVLEKRYSEVLTGEGTQCLGFLKDSSKRMSELVQGLLDFAQLGKEHEVEDVDLNKVSKNIINDNKFLIEEKQAVLDVPSLPVIQGYRFLLSQLFRNLLHNALKFSREEVAPIIKMNFSEEPHHYVFSIQDNGIGMPGESSDRIFNMFQRLHKRDEYSGLGIGLAYCKKIVEMHGGEITAHSELGKGSTFIFTLSKVIDE